MEKLNIVKKGEGDLLTHSEFNGTVDKINEIVSAENASSGMRFDMKILGSYASLAALSAAYPAGPTESGVFQIGADFYAWTGSGYEIVNLSSLKGFSLEQFIDIVAGEGELSIDFSKTPYAKVTLSGSSNVYKLYINNTKDGDVGKILVFQTGFKQIDISESLKGSIDMPLNAGTIVLLTYHNVGGSIYMYSNTVLGDVQFPTPQKIKDFSLLYSDSSICTLQWTAPYANNIYDKATEYDIRLSNSPLDADDSKNWLGMKKIAGSPSPANPGTLQKLTVSGLTAGKEYYIYIKSIKVNYGVSYESEASDFVYFKTRGGGSVEDNLTPYRINISSSNLYPQLKTYVNDTDGNPCKIENITDEIENTVFKDTGYPDTNSKDFSTFWKAYQYARDTQPYDVIIDLFETHAIDKIFFFSKKKPAFSLYGKKDFASDWVKAGEIHIAFNAWAYLDFKSMKCRFIKMSFDLDSFGKSLASGAEGFPSGEYNGSLDEIENMLVYGNSVSSKPDGIKEPVIRATSRKTVDEFFCTNGHAYQDGRIHSMCSGSHVRMYIHFGHFAAINSSTNAKETYTKLSDMKFRVNQVTWVSGNNSSGKYLMEHLRDTYKKYGLKPFLTNTGVFDYCVYDSTKWKSNRPCDGYWYPGAWKPVPTQGVGGFTKYFATTMDASSYKTYAKLCEALGAKYGNNAVDGGDTLFYPTDESADTGLDLISGIEPENEPDKNWEDWIGYSHGEEYASVVSAATDGDARTLKDEDGNALTGTKAGNILSIASGTAGTHSGYLLQAILQWKNKRSDGKIPADVFSMHRYCSNIGNQGSSTDKVQYGITMEESLRNSENEVADIIRLRDRVAPSKELWITEFGWGESGGRNTASKYQCYSMSGRTVNGWVIPDRHRSDVKGAWIVRAAIKLMQIGIDMVNYYSTECESDYFSSGRYGAGAGFEMFHWNDCKDETPGAKVAAIESYECQYDRGGFATTGLFGQMLTNGAYPITRAYWWVATMRSRLKDYVYTGAKYVTDTKVVIACFKKKEEDKGAYVVYYDDSTNSGVAGVEISVPDSVTNVRKVSVYVPEIPNPENVPSSLGNDRGRIGLPTSRKEKYVSGSWTVQNPTYGDKSYSYTQRVATYPQNPQEGDEVTVLPTSSDNPYFPIVGPVSAKYSSNGNYLSANMYEQDREEWQTEAQKDADGNVIWTKKYDQRLAWRQVDAICDYIDFSEEGRHGTTGDESAVEVSKHKITVNVSEFPDFYFFDAVPDTEFKSEISDLNAIAINSSTVELWWNNNNPEDTGYEIFSSSLPDSGYTLLKEIAAGVENKCTMSGLSEATTYYYKVRPVRNGAEGTLSDYTSVKTPAKIPAPTDLTVTERTASSITLAWNYTSEQVSDFVAFYVYRADSTGSSQQIGKVEDKTIHTFTDSGLPTGKNVSYKIRAIGLGGQSDYSNTIETRTLLPEECSPSLISAMTDKLGLKIILTYDLNIGAVESSAKDSFTLTEGGGARVISYVQKDDANPKNLIIGLKENSLSDYSKGIELLLSFSGEGIQSEYAVSLAAFSAIKVISMVGNFTDISAIYKINLCGADATLPASAEWNNLVGNPTNAAVSLPSLVDTYGRTSAVGISSTKTDTEKWGSVASDGYCKIDGIEDVVYKNMWRLPYGALSTENIVSRLSLSGLNTSHHYTIRAFGGRQYGGTSPIKMKIGSTYTPTVDEHGNESTYMMIEDVTSSDGTLNIDFIYDVTANSTDYPGVAFIEIEDYKPGTEAESKEVYLREVTVAEAVDGIVKQQTVTLHLNCIGSVTKWRAAESEDLSAVAWTDVIDSSIDVSFKLSDGFTAKAIYVQCANATNESNVRSVSVSYVDPYVPLALSNIFINKDAGRTYSRDVRVTFSSVGAPLYYKLSENSDLSLIDWVAWPDDAVDIPFTLSDGAGQKTVYGMMNDGKTTSDAKSDTIEYVLLTKHELSVSLNLPAGVDASAVSASFPVIKYGKSFIFSMTCDDDPIGAYGKIFRTINKKWVDDEKYFHPGQAVTTGSTPSKTLGYTDGCGVEHRMPIGVALWPNCGNTYTPLFMEGAVGKDYPYLTWPTVPYIMDFGGEIYYHNVNQDKWDKTDPTKILSGLLEDNAKAVEKSGFGMKVLMRPDGNNNYLTAASMDDDIAMSFAENSPAVYVYPSDDPSLNKTVAMRRIQSDDSAADLAWVQGLHDAAKPAWCMLFCHTPGAEICALLTSINDAYGKDGDNSAWFATADEVFEYWFVRRNAVITKTTDGQKVTFTLSVPEDKYYKHLDLSLIIAGVSSIDGLSIESNDNVLGLNYGIKNGALLMNVNYDAKTEQRAEKYTSLFESSQDENDKDDAEYFLSLLKSSLAAPYRTRINAIANPPVLTSCTSTAGSFSTAIGLTYSFTGKATHYMLSESSEFTGAAWSEITDSSNLSFTISDVEGSHTIYLKLKNAYGESNVMSATVTYAKQAKTLQAIAINGGDGHTSSSNVSVSMPCGGDTPTHYMLSESSEFAGAEWTAFASPVTFELSAGDGTKTIYVKVKWADGTISEVKSASIVYASEQTKVVYSKKQSSTNGVTHITTGDGVVNIISSAANTNRILADTAGNDSVISYYNDSSVAGGEGVLGSNPTEPATYNGAYSYEVTGVCAYYNEYNQPTTIVPHRIIFKAPAGTYKIRILGSTSSSNGAGTANKYYECNGVQAQPTFSEVNNFTNFVELDNVTPDANGELVVKWWGNPTRGAMCCLNLIEIIIK